MRVERVTLFVNSNLYDTKRHYTQAMQRELEKKGVEVQLIDSEERPLDAEVLDEMIAFDPDLTASFNSILPLSSGKFFWDYTTTPHLSFIIDPCFYFLDYCKSPYSLLTCVDEEDLQIVKKEAHFDRMLFFPHAADLVEESLIQQERPLDVVMIGSFYDHEGLKERWSTLYSKEICLAMERAVEKTLADGETHFYHALLSSLEERGIAREEVAFFDLLKEVDYYLRGVDRLELIRSIKECELHIFGRVHTETSFGKEGWQQLLSSSKNIHLHPPVYFEESLKILRKSKVVLNSTPSFKKGGHVRIPTGLMNGALVVTNQNLFVEHFFNSERSLITYEHKKKEELEDKIRLMLADERLRKERVFEGRERVLRGHTWEKRAGQLLEWLKGSLTCLASRSVDSD